MKSKHAARTIKNIHIKDNGETFDITYSNNWFQIVNKHENPRRWVACNRLINMNAWSRFGHGRSVVLTPAPKVEWVPTLAESFALAAVKGFAELDPSSVSHFESCAAYEESIALAPASPLLTSMDSLKIRGYATRRAILYRFYARSLIKGHADYYAILAAYEGIEL